MEILTTTFYFIITIGILVFIHELGHFLAAKLCRMRVDRFSIGFPPRAFGKKIGETDYCISWIPIGGYVKIAGMIDESFDTEFIGQEPQPWEFRAKPVRQRMFVLSAGVLMNLILAIVIFWGINFVQGEYYRQTTTVGYVASQSAAEKNGLKSGDEILSINNERITHWDAIQNAVYVDFIGEDLTFAVKRGNETLTIAVPRSTIPDISDAPFGVIPSQTNAIITEVLPGRPAEKAGLRGGDIVVAINGVKVFNEIQVTKLIKSNPQKPITLEYLREGKNGSTTATPSAEGLIGIGISSRYTGPLLHVKFGILESFPKGVQNVYNATTLFVNSIWQIVVGKASFSKSVGGPIKIAQFATRSAEVGIISFMAFVALLSVSLAVMNILPFPALDGGHLVILLYEGIFRKPLPFKVQQIVQQAGVVLLLAFMAFVIYNDIFGR